MNRRDIMIRIIARAKNSVCKDTVSQYNLENPVEIMQPILLFYIELTKPYMHRLNIIIIIIIIYSLAPYINTKIDISKFSSST